MTKVFIQALEGPPDDPIAFTGRSERDIRARWLTWDAAENSAGPWAISIAKTTPNMIVLEPSRTRNPPTALQEVHLVFEADGINLARRLQLPTSDPDRIDFAPTLTNPSTFAGLIANPDVNLVATGGISTFYLALRLKTLDQSVRNAVAHAIDVHALAPIGQGAASPAFGPVPPSMAGHDPLLRQPPCDTARARAILGRSKRTMNRPLEILCPTDTTYAGMLGNAVAAQLSATLPVKVVAVHRPTWGDALAAWKAGQGDMLIAGWHQRHARAGDPYTFLQALFHSGSASNLTGYNAADTLLRGSRRDHRKAQAAIIRHAPAVFLSHWRRLSAYHTRVKNLRLIPGALPEDRLIGVDL
jgi:ABC-type transport system substrate-binding protein